MSDHRINDLTQSISRVDDVRARQPAVELLSFHQDFPFDPVVGQWMEAIHEAISQPSNGAGRIGSQCLEVEIAWLEEVTQHQQPLVEIIDRLSSGER